MAPFKLNPYAKEFIPSSLKKPTDVLVNENNTNKVNILESVLQQQKKDIKFGQSNMIAKQVPQTVIPKQPSKDEEPALNNDQVMEPCASKNQAPCNTPATIQSTEIPSKKVEANIQNVYDAIQSRGFYVMAILGQGSTGQVLLCRSQEPSRDVAIKVAPFCSRQSRAYELIRDEKYILKQLLHQSILQVIDDWETESHSFIVTEACDYSLLDLIEDKQRLSEASLCLVIYPIMQALVYMHENQVSHGDLKPDNVMVKDGRSILIDLGYAKYRAQTFGNHACNGTPGYMAPEIWLQGPYNPCLADVYALGVTMHQLLMCSLPFDASSLEQYELEVFTKEYTPPSTVSNQLRHLLSKMLNKDGCHRITMSQVMESSWVQILREAHESDQAAAAVAADQGDNNDVASSSLAQYVQPSAPNIPKMAETKLPSKLKSRVSKVLKVAMASAAMFCIYKCRRPFQSKRTVIPQPDICRFDFIF